MDLQHLLFGFTGRINRKPWWLATIGVTVAFIVGLFLIGFISAAIGDIRGDQIGPVGWVLLGALYAVFLYIGVALTVKRLHDRDKSGWWALLLYGVTVLSGVAGAADMMGSMDDPSALGIVAGIANFIVSIWFLIWLGFLKGTQGPNRFGPDPLGATQAEAAY